jgi:hypothetical protein
MLDGFCYLVLYGLVLIVVALINTNLEKFLKWIY